MEGLFGGQEHIDLPERAHRALNSLSEMRAMFEGIHLLMEDKTKTRAHSEITETIHNVRELSKIAEHEMHEAVLSCKRARRQMLRQFSASKPVLH